MLEEMMRKLLQEAKEGLENQEDTTELKKVLEEKLEPCKERLKTIHFYMYSYMKEYVEQYGEIKDLEDKIKGLKAKLGKKDVSDTNEEG